MRGADEEDGRPKHSPKELAPGDIPSRIEDDEGQLLVLLCDPTLLCSRYFSGVKCGDWIG